MEGMMVYQKNLPQWERWVRVLAGLTLVGWSLLGTSSQLITALTVLSAVFIIGTGFIGYCPACAMVGRKPTTKTRSEQ